MYFLVYMTTRVFTYCVRQHISHTDESLRMIIRRKNLSSIIVFFKKWLLLLDLRQLWRHRRETLALAADHAERNERIHVHLCTCK